MVECYDILEESTASVFKATECVSHGCSSSWQERHMTLNLGRLEEILSGLGCVSGKRE